MIQPPHHSMPPSERFPWTRASIGTAKSHDFDQSTRVDRKIGQEAGRDMSVVSPFPRGDSGQAVNKIAQRLFSPRSLSSWPSRRHLAGLT